MEEQTANYELDVSEVVLDNLIFEEMDRETVIHLIRGLKEDY